MVEVYRHKLKDGVPREVILADIADNLRKAPDPMEVGKHLFHIACALRTVCGYGPRATAIAIEAIRPEVDGAKLVAAAEAWMTKRDAKYREDVGDAEFWEGAFTRHRRKPRTDQPKKQEE